MGSSVSWQSRNTQHSPLVRYATKSSKQGFLSCLQNRFMASSLKSSLWIRFLMMNPLLSIRVNIFWMLSIDRQVLGLIKPTVNGRFYCLWSKRRFSELRARVVDIVSYKNRYYQTNMSREYKTVYYNVTIVALTPQGDIALKGDQLPTYSLAGETVQRHVQLWLDQNKVQAADVKIIKYRNIIKGKDLNIECVFYVLLAEPFPLEHLNWRKVTEVKDQRVAEFVGRVQQGKIYPLTLIGRERDPVPTPK